MHALDTQTAHEVLALAATHLSGHSFTHHGDEYTITRATIRRSMDGWPIALDVTVADDTRGTCILGSLPVEASAVGGAR